MAYNMTERDKKTIWIGVVVAGLILGYFFLEGWFVDWKGIRADLKNERQKLAAITPASDGSISAKQAGLLETVPVMEMPENRTVQKELFIEKFNEQLKKSGIDIKTLHDLPITKTKDSSGYSKLQLQCQGKCNYGQAMNLLAGLYENPYFVGVEELSLTCDQKKRSQMEIKLTVSTFVK